MEACLQVKKSKALKKGLNLILESGNILNAGTARGNARGYRIEALSKLKDLKVTEVPKDGDYGQVP